MEFHPIASVFPLIPSEELQELADDIRDYGLKDPIWIYEGKILDGRNRSAACVIAGVDPEYREFKGTSLDAVHHAWSLNRRRRHLNSSQAAIAEAKRAKIVEEYAAEVEKLEAEAKERKRDGNAKGGRGKSTQLIGEVNRHDKETDAIRAKSAGTNRQYIRDAEKIVEEYPELVEKIETGNLTIPQAKKKISKPREPRPFDRDVAGDKLCDLLRKTLDQWPEDLRPEAAHWVREILKEYGL